MQLDLRAALRRGLEFVNEGEAKKKFYG